MSILKMLNCRYVTFGVSFELNVKGVPKVKQGAVENRDTLFVYSLI